MTIGPGVEDHDLGPLVSETQQGRVSAHVGAARNAGGARLVTGGGRPNALDDEEVFGPVLAVVPFRDERSREGPARP